MLDNIKAVIFDLDGTLVDSMWMWGRVDIEFLGARGIEVPADLGQAISGKSYTETAIYFKDRFKLDMTLDEIKAEWSRMAEDKYSHEVFLKDGAYDFLQYLRKNGIKTGIATSNGMDLVERCIQANKIGEFFDCIKIACQVKRGKPFPDIYLAVASALGVKPEECLVFEDIPNGILAGKNAGMRVCAIYDEDAKKSTDQIKELADYYITSFKQVLDNTYEVLKH